jgi:nickel-dependent lactate racemase
MQYRFLYDWVDPIELSESGLIGIFRPKAYHSEMDESHIIRRGFSDPIGSGRLSEEVRGARSVLILADDVSRPTPAARLLPFVLEELKAGGITDDRISFLMSLGTHRAMTGAEIDEKLGPGIRARFRVTNHRWDDAASMVNLGKSSMGTEILVNRAVAEAGYVIGIGNIVPHPAAGFAGGGKIVNPGCVSDETCGAFHWESVQYPSREVVGVRGNPMLRMIDEVAAQAGLRFIVNTVLDAGNGIVRLFTGHPVAAHVEGCKAALDVYGIRIPEQADIVLCDSHPADLEMWQAIKGLCTADLVMKNSGIVIMATPCPDGASSEHPELERFGYLPFDETARLVADGSVSMVIGHHMVQGGRLLQRAKRVYLVSRFLSDQTVRKLGFIPAPSVQSAYDEAVRLAGPAARVAVLENAAELFPVVER